MRHPIRRSIIYISRLHILAALMLIAVPFLFLLSFTRLTDITAGRLLSDLGISLIRIFIAYIIAALIAWLCAVTLYSGRRSLIALPLFDVLQSIPTFAALPAAILIWGRGNFTIIFFLVLAILWPIFFSIISSLKLIRHDWKEASQIAGLSGFAYVRLFLWPASIPGLITGSIVGMGDGWEALIATEIIVATQSGLGTFFQAFSQNPRITVLAILGFLMIVFTINKLVWLPLLEWSHQRVGE